MKYHRYEEILLGVIIRHNDTKIPLRVVRELDVSRFIKPEHKKIYAAISELVNSGKSPDIPNIIIKLKESDDASGGQDYLISLISIPDVLHINSNGSLESIVQKIDDNGKLWACF